MRRHEPEAGMLDELRALYREVDGLYAGWTCPTSSECCRFGLTGREPYVTSVELAAIRAAVARQGGPLAPARRALPLLDDGDRPERACPLLGHDRRCTIYEDRPLGCRTYFCQRADAGDPAPRRALTDVVRRLQALALRHTPDGDRGRPLGRLLGV